VRLLEAAVAAAIVATAIGGVLFAVIAVGKYSAQQAGPARTAALLLAQQTLRVAIDAWKYGSPGNAPAGTQTVQLPSGASGSTAASLATDVSGNGTSERVTVTVRYTPEPGRGDPGIVSISGDVVVKAPLPGLQVSRPGLVPLPSGAP